MIIMMIVTVDCKLTKFFLLQAQTYNPIYNCNSDESLLMIIVIEAVNEIVLKVDADEEEAYYPLSAFHYRWY